MRRRRRYNRGGNIPYQTGAYNNPYRRGGGIKRFHSGGRPHSHRPRRRPQPIPGGPGMPPPNVDNYSMGGAMRRNSVGPYNPRRPRPAGNNLMWEQWCVPWPECSYDKPPNGGNELMGDLYSCRTVGDCPNWANCCSGGVCSVCVTTPEPDRPIWVRRGGPMRRRYGHGGGIHTGSPNSCTDGYGNNVPC